MRERQPGESRVGALFMECWERAGEVLARLQCARYGHQEAAWRPVDAGARVCGRCWRYYSLDDDNDGDPEG